MICTMPASFAQSLGGTPLTSGRGSLTSSDSPFRQPALGAIKADGTDSEDVSSPQRLMPEFRNSATLRSRAVDNQLDLDATKQRGSSAAKSLSNRIDRPHACDDDVEALLENHSPSSRTLNRLKSEGVLTSRSGISEEGTEAISNCGSSPVLTAGSSMLGMQRHYSQTRNKLSRTPSSSVRGAGLSGSSLASTSFPTQQSEGSSSASLGSSHHTRRAARASLSEWGTQSGSWRGWDKWGGWREKHRGDEGDRNLANPDLGKTRERSLRETVEVESTKSATSNISSPSQSGEDLEPKE